MSNNPNPQQNKPASSSSFGQTGRQDTNQGNRGETNRNQGSGETAQFGGIRGGVEQAYGAEKSSRGGSQEIERCLDAIEENCRKLRDTLSAGSSSGMSRSESTEASSRQSGTSSGKPSSEQDRGSNQDRGNQAGRSTSR